MRRRLFTLCSAVLLLLCVAVIVLWVWTRGATGEIAFEGRGGPWRVVREGGRVVLDNEPRRRRERLPYLRALAAVAQYEQEAATLRERERAATREEWANLYYVRRDLSDVANRRAAAEAQA